MNKKPTEAEIIDAHDVLQVLIDRFGPPETNDESYALAAMCEARNALCWVLGHENQRFIKKIAEASVSILEEFENET